MGKLTVIGIADGKKDNITFKAWKAIENAETVYFTDADVLLLTEVGGKAHCLEPLVSTTGDLLDLNEAASEVLIRAAADKNIAFCVTGNISKSEVVRTAARRTLKAGISMRFIFGLSADCGGMEKAAAEGEDWPEGVYSIPAKAFAGLSRNREGVLITDIDSAETATDVKQKLMRQMDGNAAIYLTRPDGETERAALNALDAQALYGQGLAAYIPPLTLESKRGYTFADLLEIMKQLRAPDGCPWDREQTHDSLKRYLIEEAYEVYDAVAQNDMDMLYDELGDVLLQVVFHAEIASETNAFDLLDVTTAICKKMLNRHPHVFGNITVETSEEVLVNWDQIKKKEKGIRNFTQDLKDVPKTMPALMRSQKVQKRAAACGFDWEDYRAPFEKVYEELDELKADIEAGKAPDEEMGDVLIAVTNLARHLNLEAETVLYNGIEKFIRRFEAMEKRAESTGKSLKDMTLEEMDVLWEEIKREKQK